MKKDMTFLNHLKIAHRGLYDNRTIPENSYEAFQKALLHNMPIEFDIQLLKDDTIIVFHDNNFKRMTGYFKEVVDCTWEEVQKLSLLTTTSKILKLEDVLHLVKGKVLLDIEFKSNERYQTHIEKAFGILEKYEGPLLVKSFDPRYIYYLKKNKPQQIRGLLISTKKAKQQHLKNRLLTRWISIPLTKPDFLAIDKAGIQERWVQHLRKKKKILVWTIQEQEVEKYESYADGFLIEK